MSDHRKGWKGWIEPLGVKHIFEELFGKKIIKITSNNPSRIRSREPGGDWKEEYHCQGKTEVEFIPSTSRILIRFFASTDDRSNPVEIAVFEATEWKRLR